MNENNFLTRVTDMCHFICQKQLEGMVGRKPYLVGLDGTCGRGNDTLWMAGFCRRVYGFDIQEQAVVDTKKLLEDNNVTVRVVDVKKKFPPDADEDEGVNLIQDGHENLLSYVNKGIDVAVFNLGYLPGAIKEVTTKKDTTLIALNDTLKILNPEGILGVTLYYGHSNGKEEREAVTEWAERLDRRVFHCIRMDMPNQPNFPPENFFITRKK